MTAPSNEHTVGRTSVFIETGVAGQQQSQPGLRWSEEHAAVPAMTCVHMWPTSGGKFVQGGI